ncbi:MAG: hypothetical protein GXP35_13635, partial [Actinobacteria bacterium]|nr:hypothetical protein [Actinomycetota bacterium]
MVAHPHRLPRNVLPRRYDIDLEPALESASFIGTVRISLDVVEPADCIVLNAAELSIGSV